MNNFIPRELYETVGLMVSSDYKRRFLAEYYQLNIRYRKLEDLLNRWDELEFVPETPKEVLEEQLYQMDVLKSLLEERAVYEKIEI